jgi:hypothetical protein
VKLAQKDADAQGAIKAKALAEAQAAAWKTKVCAHVVTSLPPCLPSAMPSEGSEFRVPPSSTAWHGVCTGDQ